MNRNRHAAHAFGIAEIILLGPRSPLDHRVNGFQVAGIGRQGKMDTVSFGTGAVAGEAEMIFDVAVATAGKRQEMIFKFTEDVG